MTSKYYYNPATSSAFSTLEKFRAVVKRKPDDIKAWLEKQEAYELHRHVKKRFPRNPYSVNNVMDVWECDLVDFRALGKLNDNYKYILSVIDVFSSGPTSPRTAPAWRRHSGPSLWTRNVRALSFRCEKIPTSKVWSWNALSQND